MILTKFIRAVIVSGLFLLYFTAVTIEVEAQNRKTIENPSQFAYSFTGIVINVVDGCAVEVKIKEGRTGEIQGQNIDMPSNNSDYNGNKIIRIASTKCPSTAETIAKEKLEHMVKGKLVEVFFSDYNDIKTNKIVGQLIVTENGKDAGLEQLKSGMVRFRCDKEKTISGADRRKYKDAEKGAKVLKIGIWSNENNTVLRQ